MVLDARTRSSIYEKLRPVLGDDDANALMSEFPANDGDELVTRQFLRAELGVSQGELRAELADVRGEIAGLRTEMHDEIAGLRTEMHDEIAGLRTEMHDGFRRQTLWLAGVFGTVLGGSLIGGMALAAQIGASGATP